MIEPGQNFDHFKIIKKLGEGGMGEVYLAEDQKLNRKVALKILQKEFFDNTERLNRFNREAKTAAKINHSNVMSIYDIGEIPQEDSEQSMTYIVMEHIDGESLANCLESKKPGITELLRISEKIASGLSSAHKLGIVHRDIKMDNIMINKEGEPKILDFGLAKPIESAISYGTKDDDDNTDTVSQELTQEGKIVGTITYMSPEQARGDTVDNRSDIFSFGILLYKMFAGDFPFKGGDRVSTIAKILEARHTPLRQVNDILPGELERIIDKCLQKNPDDRYQDTRDLVVDLRSLRRQFDSGITESSSSISGVVARPEMKKTVTFSGKKLIYVLGGLFIGLAIVVISIVAIVMSNSPDGKEIADLSNLGSKIMKDLADKGIIVEGQSVQIPGINFKEDALAIFSFENKTGDESLDWLQSGLPEILLTDLAQNGSIDIISRNRILDLIENDANLGDGSVSHQDYLEAAQSLGASTALSGSFFKMGDKIRIDARLEDIKSGKIILGEKVVGEEPFDLVDSLTEKIAVSLNIREKMATDKDVASMTTSSSEAYKQYSLGMDKLTIYKFDDAIEHFKTAVNIDTTFALAYMRIGMTYGFRNRVQQGVPYFITAKKYESKLSVKDKSLLDIFINIWQERDFDDAFAKLKTYVNNYPDDKEARAFYALFLLLFDPNKEAAMAQFDTVLMLDPRHHMSLSGLSEYYFAEDEHEKAVEYAELLKKYHPESRVPYTLLMDYYFKLSQLEDAANEAKELLEVEPDNVGAINSLSRVYLLKKDFEKARQYVELYGEKSKDDPYRKISYYDNLANLDIWFGKFNSAIDNFLLSLDQAFLVNDSQRISSGYVRIAGNYLALNMLDSALFYSKKSYEWAKLFQTLNYPFRMVQIDPSLEPEARPLFDKAINNFRSKIPQEMWNLADIVQSQFDAIARSDTLKLIETYKVMIKDFNQEETTNLFELGELQVLLKQYDDGRTSLMRLIEGENETTRGYYYITSLYYLGIANEALGNRDEAIANFQELLKYWGNPEIETKEIKDTRERLNRLTS